MLAASGWTAATSVFHLAAAVGVRLIVESPVHTIETNVHGTGAGAAARQPPAHAGGPGLDVGGVRQGHRSCPSAETSALVFGAPQQHRWAYACSKALDEFLGLAYWRERQLPVTIVRLFNTVGTAPDRDATAWSCPRWSGRRWPASR